LSALSPQSGGPIGPSTGAVLEIAAGVAILATVLAALGAARALAATRTAGA